MKKLMLITLLVAWGILSFAQGIYNDGAHIVSTDGSYWVVDNGSFTLTSTSASNLAQMDNLVIMGDASLALDASAASSHLTVSGDLTVNGSLTVESTANGTSSLIVEGTPTGNVTVERYLTADKWHYISGQTNISGNFSTLSMGLSGGAGNDQFYRWEEDYDYGGNIGNWVDILNGEDGTGSNTLMDDEGFEDCKGYAITYKTTSETLSLSGVPYVANQNITITKTTGSNHEGSNLVGNPFCSTIAINDDADASNNFLDQNAAALDDAYEAIYIWNESDVWNGSSNADYDEYSNSTGEAFYASPGQAFMVQAASDEATLYFNTSIRKHGTSTFFKNTENEDVGYFTLYVNSPQDQYNKTRFYFRDGMTKGLDPSYDVGKMKGNPDLALYSILIQDNGKHFAVQALPYFEEDYVVPVGIDVSQEGQYTFEANDMEQIPDDVHIFLEDLKTGNITDLKKNSTYTCFLDETGSITGRFVLHFTLSPFGEKELQANENVIQVWANNKTINIYNPEQHYGTIRILDISGRAVDARDLNGKENQQFSLNLNTGIYIINTTTNENSYSNKLFIK